MYHLKGSRRFALHSAALAFALSSAVACGNDPNEPHPTASKGPGREILFIHFSLDGPSELYSINPDGTNMRNLTQNRVEDDWAGSWSPDGSKIVFASNPGDGHYDLFVMDADGSNQVKLLDMGPKVDETVPKWSPDGKRILYTQVFQQSEEIHVVNADGSNPVRLTSGGHELYAEWSPDGKRITYSRFLGSDDPPERIYIMNTDGTDAKPIGPAGASGGPWAPDGKTMLITKDNAVYSMRADGTGLVQLLFDPKLSGWLSWSPNGKRILFSSQRTGPWLLYTMNADGSDVTPIPGQGINNGSIAWRP